MKNIKRVAAAVLVSSALLVSVAAGPASACAYLSKWCMASGPTQTVAWEGRVIR